MQVVTGENHQPVPVALWLPSNHYSQSPPLQRGRCSSLLSPCRILPPAPTACSARNSHPRFFLALFCASFSSLASLLSGVSPGPSS
eukprot:759598-Hanusia_phi.AAC.1